MDTQVEPGKSMTSGQNIFRPGDVAVGSYTLKATADPDNKVAESNENNNEITTRWSLAQGEKPDLIVSKIDVSSTEIQGETIYSIFVTIKNQGRGNAYFPYNAKILDCPELRNTKTASTSTTYKPGDSERFFFAINHAPPGQKTLTFIVDPANLIAESDETNNTATTSVQIK